MATNRWGNCCSSNKLCSVPSAISPPISFINGMWCHSRGYATRHIWFQIWAFTSGARTKASASNVPHAHPRVISSQHFHCLIIKLVAARGWVEGKTPLCHSLWGHSFKVLQTKRDPTCRNLSCGLLTRQFCAARMYKYRQYCWER